MEIEIMRTAIRGKYKSDAWARKVATMPEDQVYAIYMRMKTAGMFDKHKAVYIQAPPPPPTEYYCRCCKGTFFADNPSLTECALCGSKRITTDTMVVDIKKG